MQNTDRPTDCFTTRLCRVKSSGRRAAEQRRAPRWRQAAIMAIRTEHRELLAAALLDVLGATPLETRHEPGRFMRSDGALALGRRLPVPGDNMSKVWCEVSVCGGLDFF